MADADGPVFRDATIAFDSLQLTPPPQLGSQAGAAEDEAPPPADDADRCASPPGEKEARFCPKYRPIPARGLSPAACSDGVRVAGLSAWCADYCIS